MPVSPTQPKATDSSSEGVDPICVFVALIVGQVVVLFVLWLINIYRMVHDQDSWTNGNDLTPIIIYWAYLMVPVAIGLTIAYCTIIGLARLAVALRSRLRHSSV